MRKLNYGTYEIGDDDPIEVNVTYHFIPGSRGGRYDPPDSPEVDIVSVKIKGKSVINDLSEKEFQSITDQIFNERGYY